MIGPILGAAPRRKFDPSAVAFTVSGNSISDPSLSDLWTQVQALAPMNGQITVHNCGHSGYSINQLAASPSDVDGSYENGKVNYLFFWELTNSIWNDGRTGPQTIGDAIAYIQARQVYVAANRPGQQPWVVILATGLPRGGLLGNYFTAAQGEIEMEYCNSYIRQNYRSMGAVAYVEMRRSQTPRPDRNVNPVAGFPFDFTGNGNAANFPQSLWDSAYTHPTNGAGGGKSYLAQYIGDVLKRLPAR